MKPMPDPGRDLKGATPEKPVRALFRRTEPLRPETRSRGKAVVGVAVTVQETPTNEAGNRVPHLRKRF